MVYKRTIEGLVESVIRRISIALETKHLSSKRTEIISDIYIVALFFTLYGELLENQWVTADYEGVFRLFLSFFFSLLFLEM